MNPMPNPLLAVNWLDLTTNTLLAGFVFVGLILIMIVLIQRGRGGGLASAFGGGGGNTAFGSKTGDVLTWATSVIFGVFLLLAVALNLLANKQTKEATTSLPRIETPASAALPAMPATIPSVPASTPDVPTSPPAAPASTPAVPAPVVVPVPAVPATQP